MFLKTVDELYDALLGKANAVVELEDPTAQKISPITQLLYTKDYTTVRTQGNAVKWQTGYETTFLVLKPSRPVFAGDFLAPKCCKKRPMLGGTRYRQAYTT